MKNRCKDAAANYIIYPRIFHNSREKISIQEFDQVNRKRKWVGVETICLSILTRDRVIYKQTLYLVKAHFMHFVMAIGETIIESIEVKRELAKEADYIQSLRTMWNTSTG